MGADDRRRSECSLIPPVSMGFFYLLSAQIYLLLAISFFDTFFACERLIIRDTEEFRYRDECKTSIPQGPYYLRNALDTRLMDIMKEYDTSLFDILHRGNIFFHIFGTPVVGIDRPEDQRESTDMEDIVIDSTIWGTESARIDTYRLIDHSICFIDFFVDLTGCQTCKWRMRVGVIADLMSLIVFTFEYVGISFCILSEYIKSCMNSLCP
jgi:hypothetical protein